VIQSQPRQIVHKILSQKTCHKKGLGERLKVKALSSNPRTEKIYIYLIKIKRCR
jgi:hypothetical protein